MIYEETNEAILSFLETWVETLANGETSKALEMIVNTPIPVKDYGFRRFLVNLHLREPAKPFQWSTETVDDLIAGYGALGDDLGFRVTSAYSAKGTLSLSSLIEENDTEVHGDVHPRFPYAVYWFNHSDEPIGLAGYAHIDYPLNGEWSEVSSEFHINRTLKGVEIELERIEVM